MPSREENLEVAKLAKLIGSQLNMIDKFSLERSNVPANRIDMNKFVAQVTNPNKSFGDASGYVPEAYVQQMVPDISQSNKQPEPIPQVVNNQPELIPLPQVIEQQPQIVSPQHLPVETIPPQSTQQNHIATSNSNLNVDKVELEKFLDRIACCLEKLVDYYTSHNIIDSNKKRNIK